MSPDFAPAAVDMPPWFDAPAELQRFRDHHAARGSLMADWNAAWRTWCANARRFHEERAGPPRTPVRGSEPTRIALEELDRLRALEALEGPLS